MQKIDDLGNMKIQLALIIIKSCDQSLIMPTMKSVFGMTTLQINLVIDYLIEYNFLVLDSEKFILKLSDEGYNFLRDSNMETLSFEELNRDENENDFNYKDKVKKYIPN